MNFHDDNGKNQRIVTLGAAELGIAGLLFTFTSIFITLDFFQVKVPIILGHIPVTGFFLSLGWILMSWKLIESADKAKDIRERRRYALYWFCYACLMALFNAGAIIFFITKLVIKKYVESTLLTGTIIAVAILLVRGYIFVRVISMYSKELALKSDPKNQTRHETQERNSQGPVVVTAV